MFLPLGSCIRALKLTGSVEEVLLVVVCDDTLSLLSGTTGEACLVATETGSGAGVCNSKQYIVFHHLNCIYGIHMYKQSNIQLFIP